MKPTACDVIEFPGPEAAAADSEREIPGLSEDLRLPDMRDLSLLATLRQLLPSAKLILMTAFGTPEIAQQAALLGATVINKPFELNELDRLVVPPDAEC